MKKCLVVPGPFLPYNDTITQLCYKHLRLLDMEYDVCALSNEAKDPDFERFLSNDPYYNKFHIHNVDKYNNVFFSIKNVNLFKGLRHMKKYIEKAVSMYDGHDYLYTNTFPCYTIRAGVELKKTHPSIKWIASVSDPINHSPYKYDIVRFQSLPLPEKIAFNLYCKYYVVDEDERDAFEQADLLVFICEEQRDFMIEQYQKYFHRIPEEEIRKKCVIVPLNYIPEWNQFIPNLEYKPNDTYTLAHFGRIYGLRFIEEFLYAFKEFTTKYPDLKIQVEQYGEFKKTDLKLIKELNLSSYFKIHEKVPYAECIERMKESDAVLLFDTILDEDKIQPYLPSKIMEYSLLKKNVLAVTTKRSPSYRIMKNTDAIACEYDRKAILKGLEELIIEKKPSVIEYATTNEEAIKQLQQRIMQMD